MPFRMHHLPCILAALSQAAASYHEGAGVLQYVNPKIGTFGITPNGNGGMIPSVSPPFGMTRWTPQTREVCPGGKYACYIPLANANAL
jgi:putative alpha-1,2-mannosidase